LNNTATSLLATNPDPAADVFVAKLSPGTNGPVERLYATFLGGTNSDYGFRLDLDRNDNVYVVGETFSTNFLTTSNNLISNVATSSFAPTTADVLVTKLNANGALVYSVMLGGTGQDEGWDIGVDAAGHAHLVGLTFSTNFPTANTSGFLRATNSGGVDAFVAELSSDGTTLLHSAYLGGLGSDFGYGLAVDPAGNSYVVGQTYSTNFPTLHAFQPAFGGTNDAFLAKIVGDGQPQIQIAPSAQQVVLSWPAYWPEFAVQAAPAFFPTNQVVTNTVGTNQVVTTNFFITAAWQTLTNAPVPSNGTLNLTLGATNDARFFRLQR
jgi:hypothetical protein